jgi:hypothetical protein
LFSSLDVSAVDLSAEMVCKEGCYCYLVFNLLWGTCSSLHQTCGSDGR